MGFRTFGCLFAGWILLLIVILVLLLFLVLFLVFVVVFAFLICFLLVVVSNAQLSMLVFLLILALCLIAFLEKALELSARSLLPYKWQEQIYVLAGAVTKEILLQIVWVHCRGPHELNSIVGRQRVGNLLPQVEVAAVSKWLPIFRVLRIAIVCREAILEGILLKQLGKVIVEIKNDSQICRREVPSAEV